MRCKALSTSLFLLPVSALQLSPIFASFYEPSLLLNETLLSDENYGQELLKRDGNCPANFESCTTLNAKYGGACCTSGSVCTTDHARNIACCPTGATCTGSLSQATATTTSEGGAALGSTATQTTTGSQFTTATTNSGSTITPAASLSYPSNSYFPFPYIPTSYSNSAACNSAYLDCQSNYAACTADLQGGSAVAFGVTIVAPEGGVTVAPTIQSLGSSSASSICQSLSSVACYDIQSSNCAQFGQGTGGSFVVSGTGTNAARPTGVGCMIGVVAGMGFGFVGQMV